MSGIPRWPSRDPIGDKGGNNLYGFDYNSPIDSIDTDGRIVIRIIGRWVGATDSTGDPNRPMRKALIGHKDIGWCCVCEKTGKLSFSGPLENCSGTYRPSYMMTQRTYAWMTGGHGEDLTDTIVPGTETTEVDDCPHKWLNIN